MKRKEVKYIGFYDFTRSKQHRVFDIAATIKMDYICEALNRAGFSVHLISPSWFVDNSFQSKRWVKGLTHQISEKKRVTFSPSFVTKTRLGRNFKIVFSLVWLLCWLIINVRRHEKILVYHVQWLSIPIRWAKNIIGFELILEVEEIYGQVWENKTLLKNWELKLIAAANYFIVVSEALGEILGDRVKIVIYGDLSLPVLKEKISKGDKINVVYAGSIDFTKGGALNAVKTAEFLPANYIIHILGTGNKEAINILSEDIKIINKKLDREAVIYHGLITGKEFDEIMYNFSIGINPQLNGDYMETAFPSKVIKYMSYNLRVVSTPIKSIGKSLVSDLIAFSEDDLPESIAKAILKLKLDTEYDSRELLRFLDLKFVSEIKNILE